MPPSFGCDPTHSPSQSVWFGWSLLGDMWPRHCQSEHLIVLSRGIGSGRGMWPSQRQWHSRGFAWACWTADTHFSQSPGSPGGWSKYTHLISARAWESQYTEESKAAFRNREKPAQSPDFSVTWPNKFHFLLKPVELGFYVAKCIHTDTGCVEHTKINKTEKLINKMFTKILIVQAKYLLYTIYLGLTTGQTSC